jgi:hypothetical protein
VLHCIEGGRVLEPLWTSEDPTLPYLTNGRLDFALALSILVNVAFVGIALYNQP